jgi:hypothetical protein
MLSPDRLKIFEEIMNTGHKNEKGSKVILNVLIDIKHNLTQSDPVGHKNWTDHREHSSPGNWNYCPHGEYVEHVDS